MRGSLAIAVEELRTHRLALLAGLGLGLAPLAAVAYGSRGPEPFCAGAGAAAVAMGIILGASVVSSDLTTGMSEAEAAAAALAERPLLVLIEDPDAERGGGDEPAFQDERIAVGARFFDCLRISRKDAKEDRLLSPHAGKAPALVLLRPNFEITSVQPARFSASKVFEAMCSAPEQ